MYYTEEMRFRIVNKEIPLVEFFWWAPWTWVAHVKSWTRREIELRHEGVTLENRRRWNP